MNNLPPSDHYQYFSHLFHSKNYVPFGEYKPLPNWHYPDNDLSRFTDLFSDSSYVKDARVLDLGCHTGYLSYIAKYNGAKSVCGVNARLFPLEVARYAFDQLNMTDYAFEQGNIEDFDFLKTICKNKDTLILTGVLEHLRNPYAVVEIISQSDIQNLIFQSNICNDFGPPMIQYYLTSTDSQFAVYDGYKEMAFGATPNLSWLEMVLYHHGWKIEFFDIGHKFDRNWFAVPGLTKFTPKNMKVATILAKKFVTQGKDNWEN